jgi:hypothetical protein
MDLCTITNGIKEEHLYGHIASHYPGVFAPPARLLRTPAAREDMAATDQIHHCGRGLVLRRGHSDLDVHVRQRALIAYHQHRLTLLHRLTKEYITRG